MINTIKKYPTEIMGLYFSFTFLSLAVLSLFIEPVDGFVIIPLTISIPVFSLLLGGLIGIYSYANNTQPQSWRKCAELFIMLAAMSSSLSDGFWIFSLIASVIIVIGSFKSNTKIYRSPILISWWVLVVVALISSFSAIQSQSLSFGAAFGLLLYSLYFLAVYQQNFFEERGEEFVQRIGVLISFSITSTVIFSVWHYFMPYWIDVLIFQFQPQTGYGDSFGMASIYGQWPTHSSAFLSLAFWTLIGIRVNTSLSSFRKYILNIGIFFSLVGALATLSRNAFLFLVLSIGIALLILLIKEKSKKMWLICLGVGATFSAILVFFVIHFEKWRNLFLNPLKQYTIANRIEQYKFGIEQITTIDNPFLGIGLMNFGVHYRTLKNDLTLPDYLHQLFLSITLEIGYIGLIVFLVLLILIGKNIVQNYKKNNKNIIFVIVFFSWLATGIFDNWLYFMWSSTLFMILIALGSKNPVRR